MAARRATKKPATVSRPSPGIKVRVLEITPDMAERFLEKNGVNRRMGDGVIRKYAADMRSCRWQVGTGALVFAADGTLLDGQHRLSGCIAAGVPFTSVVIEGADIATMHNIDQNKTRSCSDVLGWMGEKNTNLLASAIRIGWLWSAGDPFDRHTTPTIEECLDWLDGNPSIRLAVVRAMPLRRQWGCPVSGLAPVLHRLELVDHDATEIFLTEVTTGVGLAAGAPTLALRNWLSAQLLATATSTLTARRPLPGVYMTMWIKAWNAFVCGQEVNQLRYVRREEFPDVLDLAGDPTKLVNEKDML